MPDWFLRKFEDSIFNLFPLELEFAYYFIVFIETLVFILFLFTFFRKDFIFDGGTTLTHYAFFLSFFLFFVLFVGSFLVKDYENGLNDFVFFCGSAYLFSLYKNSFISNSNK